MIDQSYLQCHFFSPQAKDKDMHGKKPQAGRMYRIGEAARELDLPTSVLRFWEGEFPGLQPVRTPKGQRLYTERDMEILRKIRSLLHEQGMTIEGARRVLSGASPVVIPAAQLGEAGQLYVDDNPIEGIRQAELISAEEFEKLWQAMPATQGAPRILGEGQKA